MKLVFATHNAGKLEEMRTLLEDLDIDVVSADEAGVYDVIFIPSDHDRTFAVMSLEEKNALSHRGQSFRQLKEFLKTFKDMM